MPRVTDFELANRALAKSVNRYGDLPLGAVIRGDERYNRPGLFNGPRGWDYWDRLENPAPYQNPDLWPDKRPTYLWARMAMPAGSSLTMHSRFPRARYMKLAMYRFEKNTFVSVGSESLGGWEIEPDPGASNPFVVGADRTVKDRDFTIQVLAQDPPQDPADRRTNTMYVGTEETETQLMYRIYVSDEGWDGAGWGPADSPSTEGPGYTVEGKLADGTPLSGEEVVERFSRPEIDLPPQVDAKTWYGLVNADDNDPRLDAETAPARVDSQWENFYGMKYSIVGLFKGPEVRDKMGLQRTMEAGGDPTTQYMMQFTNRKFGPVYVFQGKMPTFPDTFAGTETMPGGQVQYWSNTTVGSGPSGEVWDGLSDFQVPLDDDRNYTIVVSSPEDRPTNATDENGIAWMDWGPGEGLDDDPRNRTDFGMMIMRFMACDPDWENSPIKATTPGTEAEIMGAYYPKGYYTTKADFEAEGPRTGDGSS
jgi:hypothetical protein